MKNLKKVIAITAAIAAIGTTSITSFAASAYSTPAEAVAALTGRTVESVQEEKAETGKTYGKIAYEAGKSDEFKTEMIEMKKSTLDQKVESGEITQEKADEILAAIEAQQLNCNGDGSGSAKIGKNNGIGFGNEKKVNQGQNKGANGKGTEGQMKGSGQSLRDGSCS